MRLMKDSGIEWIGQIPNEWIITKSGAFCDERNTKVAINHQKQSCKYIKKQLLNPYIRKVGNHPGKGDISTLSEM